MRDDRRTSGHGKSHSGRACDRQPHRRTQRCADHDGGTISKERERKKREKTRESEKEEDRKERERGD